MAQTATDVDVAFVQDDASGVGFARNPPVFLQPGDQMEVLIEGMGGLGNPVVEETNV